MVVSSISSTPRSCNFLAYRRVFRACVGIERGLLRWEGDVCSIFMFAVFSQPRVGNTWYLVYCTRGCTFIRTVIVVYTVSMTATGGCIGIIWHLQYTYQLGGLFIGCIALFFSIRRSTVLADIHARLSTKIWMSHGITT